MATEFELKYHCSPEDHDRIRTAYPGGWTQTPMSTTYYDGLDGQISRKRWTLRHRREDVRDVCTLKTPGENNVRGEWETECGDILQALPVLEAASGQELPRELKEVCGARFTRLATVLEQPDFTAELALDSGVLLGGGTEIPLCECELELKSGDPAALTAFAAKFQKEFLLTEEPKNKFARAVALAQEA